LLNFVSHADAARLVSGCLPGAAPYDADIVILTMGRVQATLAAVASALRQQNVTSYVALLEQGGPPEGRPDYVRLFRGRRDAGYFVSAGNLGVGGGRNFLTSVGRGRIIVAIDNDATFGDAFVVYDALRIFRHAPLLGAMGFRVMDGSGSRLDESSWGYPAALKARSAGRFLTTTFVGAGHAIRRAAWLEAGGYDARLFFTWEEYDFALRAIACGWHVEYRGELAVRHATAAEARLRWRAGRTRWYVRNRLLIARKWGASWVSLLPRICGYLLKGALAGGFWQAARGVAGAVALDARLEKRVMPARMRRYLAEHEGAHRGALIQRLAPELFGRLPERASG
jgi:GT2 family glycosyltransferase